MSGKVIVLAPIRETKEDYARIEARIIAFFRKEIYLPLMREFGQKPAMLTNAADDLLKAIQSGRIYFYRGHFRGKFDSTLSRELRRLGAEWDRKQGSYAVPQSKLPIDVRNAISFSEAELKQTFASIDKRIAGLVPADIADQVKFDDLFDSALWKVEKGFQKSVRGITIAPDLAPKERKRIADEYTKSLQLNIQDWAADEIVNLRKEIEKRAFQGQRYEGAIAEIQKSYGVSVSKAKFLARQETSLLMTKFKQVRYQAAGVNEYIWGCVNMGVASPSNPHGVRPMHKALEGKTFAWDNPPVVDSKGNRKNPGQDYNCRCFAKPVVRF